MNKLFSRPQAQLLRVAAIGSAFAAPILARATDDPNVTTAVTAIQAIGTGIATVIGAIVLIVGGFAVGKHVIAWLKKA